MTLKNMISGVIMALPVSGEAEDGEQALARIEQDGSG